MSQFKNLMRELSFFFDNFYLFVLLVALLLFVLYSNTLGVGDSISFSSPQSILVKRVTKVDGLDREIFDD